MGKSFPQHKAGDYSSTRGVFGYLYSNAWIAALLFLLIFNVYYAIVPDIMPFNNGFGIEGFDIYRHFAIHLNVWHMNGYSIQRIFPFVVLHIVFKVFGISFTDVNMIIYFQIFQILLAIGIVLLWQSVAKMLKLGHAAIWIGHISMILNFATLKHDVYIPFTYDRLALFSSLASLYFYVSQKRVPLFIVSIISLTIWPTAIVFNLIMIMVPYADKLPSSSNSIFAMIWSTVLAAIISGIIIYIIYIQKISTPSHLAPAIRWSIPIGLLIVLAYIIYTQYSIIKLVIPRGSELFGWIKHLARFRSAWIGAATLIIAYLILTRIIGDSSHPYLSPRQFAINFTYGAVQRPGQFLISHAIYYGIPVLLIAIFWRRAVLALRSLGLGCTLMFIIILIQSVNSETRQMANALPLLALIAAMIVNTINISRTAIGVTVIIAFIISKGWLRLNAYDPSFGLADDVFPMNGFSRQEFLNWPQQVYFMNFGPWISNKYLLLQTSIIIIFGIILYATFNKRPSEGQH